MYHEVNFGETWTANSWHFNGHGGIESVDFGQMRGGRGGGLVTVAHKFVPN